MLETRGVFNLDFEVIDFSGFKMILCELKINIIFLTTLNFHVK